MDACFLHCNCAKAWWCMGCMLSSILKIQDQFAPHPLQAGFGSSLKLGEGEQPCKANISFF